MVEVKYAGCVAIRVVFANHGYNVRAYRSDASWRSDASRVELPRDHNMSDDGNAENAVSVYLERQDRENGFPRGLWVVARIGNDGFVAVSVPDA